MDIYAVILLLANVSIILCDHQTQSYGILAELLYKATPSSSLADNVKMAGTLLNGHLDASDQLKGLVRAFGSLKGDKRDLESMCSIDNLANMRQVAEIMRNGGNLGPDEITEPIRRLNRMIIKLIGDAQPVCPAHLDSKWTKSWYARFSDKKMKGQIERLSIIPATFLYEGYLGAPQDPAFEGYYWGRGLAAAVADEAVNNGDPDTRSSEDKSQLGLQLREYVYKPCKEFVTFEQAKEVLAPYNDLLMSWYIVYHGYMEEFFENEEEQFPWGVRTYGIGCDRRVRELVSSYRACQRLLAMPEANVLNQVHESRVGGTSVAQS